ncbi:hypothetical protein [uncultured Desulfovibrio sp.]|uniref:hypothetical protein n=1 Tax=uncultured Desulfovibrio sp. TaxID=167968 RepID=UPI002603D68B|nr:hypothetical protein [uncultured Desulfovibrio sp.]
MRALPFTKWSPSGNTTLLFPAESVTGAQQAATASQALMPHLLGGEQAGFCHLRERRLRMAGGEFCVNATRAFGALLALEEERTARQAGTPHHEEVREHAFEVQVSGWQGPVGVRVRGSLPEWRVAADLELPACPMQQPAPGVTLVRLPGIAHLLLDERHVFPEDFLAASALLRREYELAALPASGVVWWRQVQHQLEMFPVVHVRDAGTTCLENACGSGALALGLRLCPAGARRVFTILQPGGEPLEVTVDRQGGAVRATVDGPVRLVAEGRLWLPEGATDRA